MASQFPGVAAPSLRSGGAEEHSRRLKGMAWLRVKKFRGLSRLATNAAVAPSLDCAGFQKYDYTYMI